MAGEHWLKANGSPMYDVKKSPFGFAAMLFQLAVVFIGMPDQIYRNYIGRTVGPLSLAFITLGLLASASWLVHGAREAHDKYLVIPQIPAVIFGAILIGQILLYH